MKRCSTILTLAATAALLVLSLSAIASSPGATAQVIPEKRPVQKVALPGVGLVVNDTCAAAKVIPSAGPFPYADPINTTGYGTDPTIPSCGGSVDAWWMFTPATSGPYVIHSCGSSYDTILAVYTGACAALTEVACNDDACGLQSGLLLDLVSGTTYYIQLLGFAGDFGAATLTVEQGAPYPSVFSDFNVSSTILDPWGIGASAVSGARAVGWVWIAGYCSAVMTEFTNAGVPTGVWWNGYWADSEYDETRAIMYSMDLDNTSGCGTRDRQDNCIHTWDPTNGVAGPTICDPAGVWSASANQGVAHDPVTDTLYVGGWNTNTVYHIEGLGSATPGAVLGSWPFTSPAGMAWLCDGTLAIVQSNISNTLAIVNPSDGSVLRSYTLPGGGIYGGAGLDAESAANGGALWAINQNSFGAYRLDPGAVCGTCTLTCTASATPTSGTAPLAVAFTSTASPVGCSGSPTFAWTFGDGGTSTAQNPSYTYNAAGTYTWDLTVTVDGVTCTQTGTITVSAPCSLTCTASATPTSGTAPLAVTFTSTATPTGCTGSPTFAWAFGDGGTSTAQNPSYTYNAAGTYTWNLTVTVDGVTCTQTGTITVSSPCSLTCTASANPAMGQAPLAVAFTSTATPTGCTGSPTFAWAFGDGGTSTAQNPNYTYVTPGTYTWILTVTVDGVTCTQSDYITVTPPPCTLTCTASATPTSGTAPLAVTFTSTATPTGCAGTPTFAWAFGDGGTSTDQNPSYTYVAAGSYTWDLTVTVDGVTCTQRGTLTVSAPPICTLTCTASATPTSGMAPLAVAFTSTATPTGCTGSPTFAWTFGDGGTSTAQNPSYTYNAAGTYTWTLTVTVDGVTCTQTGTITVAAPAYDVYIYDDYGRASLCLNSGTGEFQYNILTGYGAGQSFTGIALLTFYNGVLNFRTPAGLPYSLFGSYLQNYHKGKASFTHRPARIYSTAYDNNTLDNPPGCGGGTGTK